MKILFIILLSALILIILNTPVGSNGPVRNGGNFQDLQESKKQKEKKEYESEKNIQKEEKTDQFDDDFDDEYDEEYIEKGPNMPEEKSWWKFWE